MRVAYLTGERLALRAMRTDDKDYAAAWFDSSFPINAGRAEAFLKDELKELSTRTILPVAVCGDDDEIVGGVRVQTNGKHSDIYFHMAPWLTNADARW